MDNFKENSMDETDKNRRKTAVTDLNHFLEKFQNSLSGQNLNLAGDLRVNLFGSTASGFGSKNSDLDCCVTAFDKISGNLIPDAVAAGFSSEKASKEVCIIAEFMQDDFSDIFDEIEAVPDAKVPIIRFRHIPTLLEGDLSIYNTLPLRNTKMLNW